MISSFLDNAERLATRDFEPTDDDIVRARLRTLDIQEYELNLAGGTWRFSLPHINVTGFFLDGESQMWKIYDVGGSRTQVLFTFSL